MLKMVSISQSTSRNKANGDKSDSKVSNQDNVTACYYCKKTNHKWENCYKLKNNQNAGKTRPDWVPYHLRKEKDINNIKNTSEKDAKEPLSTDQPSNNLNAGRREPITIYAYNE